MKINTIYRISDKPIIWASIGSKNWNNLKNKTDKPAYLLAHTMWYFSWFSLYLYYKQRNSLKKRNIELILLHNSKRELFFAKLFGFKSYLINHNIQVNEHFFYVNSAVKKKYTAIYTAVAKKYKRIHLAALIKNLYIITYFWPDTRNSKGEWDLHAFEPKIKHADFNRFRIDVNDVNIKMNESKCGLALSKKEGAMFASIEYLLCGLPVVSTESKGGRDFFFTKENSIICKDAPESVFNSVNEIIQRNINPMEIRNSTLKLMRRYRMKYVALIIELHVKNNCEAPNKEELYFKIWGNEKGISSLIIS